MFTLIFVLLVLAGICFLIAAANVPSQINLLALGLSFAVLGVLAYFYPRL